MDAETRDAILGHIQFTGDEAALAGCDLVIESIVEDPQVKSDLFKRLEGICSEKAILATNTSTLSVTAMMSACKQRGRVAGLHFFNPAPVMKLVEVVHAFETSEDTIRALMGFCTEIGKAVGGGFPLSAIAGTNDVMACFDKDIAEQEKYVPMTGTLSGNPIAAAAGLATLEILKRPGTYEKLFENGRRLMAGLRASLDRAGVEAEIVGVPSLFDLVFTSGEVRNYRDTLRGDAAKMQRLNGLLRERGILKGESKYYLSTSLEERVMVQVEEIDGVDQITIEHTEAAGRAT